MLVSSLFKKERPMELGMVVHICNPSTQETEAGGVKVQGQSGLHSETFSKKRKGH
jgi:hypothetical protein